MNSHEPAIVLLYNHLAALPHSDYGVINMLPFAHDSDQVRTIKRHVCEAIVGLLDQHGHLADADDSKAAVDTVSIVCSRCGNTLTVLGVSDGGSAVDAAAFIAQLAGLNPQCPHAPLTLEDLRVSMQDRFYDEIGDDDGTATNRV